MAREFKRLLPGDPFPDIRLEGTDNTSIALAEQNSWTLVFIYRGAHCGICKTYLGDLEAHRQNWEKAGIDAVVASADPVERVSSFLDEAGYKGRGAGGLSVTDMKSLGLWMTGPDQSPIEYVHPEPAMFLVDPEHRVGAAEVSSLAFVRPNPALLSMGLDFIIERGIRPPFGRYEVA